MFKQKILLFSCVILLSPIYIYGWGNNVTHPKLTIQAMELLISEDARFSYLRDYLRSTNPGAPELRCLDEGSVKEDYGTGPDWNEDVWGSEQDPKVPRFSWKSHGYNPVTDKAWAYLPTDNTHKYAGKVWENILEGDNPIFHIGRMCHLIEDMTSPAHANAVFHGTGDDLESYAEGNYDAIVFEAVKVKKPSTHGITGELQEDSYSHFIKNVVWQAYYMTTFWGGLLIDEEGDEQPDSELKRMFPYDDGKGLRFDPGGFFNAGYVVDDVGYYYPGFTFFNPEWWPCKGDPNYFYIHNIDGDDSGHSDPGAPGCVPRAFKRNKLKRIKSEDALHEVMEANDKDFRLLLCESLFPLAVEWTAGFLELATAPHIPPPLEGMEGIGVSI
jgi:hypothetical protein